MTDKTASRGLNTVNNTLSVPSLYQSLDFIREDLRKVVIEIARLREVTEALAEAFTQIIERLGLPK